MSYTEKHIGTVRPIDLKGNTVEEWCKEYCQEKLSEINCKCYDSWIECFRHNFVLNDDTKYIVTDKRVFELVYDEEMDDDLVCFANNNDGTISYGCEFYNGGTCLQELLCDCLDRHLEVNPLTEVVNQPTKPVNKSYKDGVNDTIKKAVKVLRFMTENRLGKEFMQEFKDMLKYDEC